MSLETKFTKLVGCKYPIVQTGMGWVSGARLTAATSSAGGLGILAAATMTHEELIVAIDKVKSRTDAPFGVNIRGDQPNVDEVIDLLIEKGVRLASFAGAPRKPVIAKLKAAGILSMPTVGKRRHAEKMQEWGVDAVIAQGHEGGGHTGPVPTTLLLPEVVDAVDIPVLAAGGFRDGRGLVAALAYGADGIAMGTRFLLTQESHVPAEVKQIYLDTPTTGTVVTTAIDGAPQRVIITPFVHALEKAGVGRFVKAAKHALAFRKLTGAKVGDLMREGVAMKTSRELSWAQVAMAANAPMMTRASMVEGRHEVGILPSGQVAGCIRELPAVADLIAEIVQGAEATLERLNGG